MSESNTAFSRRDAIRTIGAAATIAAFSRVSLGAARPTQIPGRTRSIRLAHLTDLHLQPELDAVAGVAACLHHVQSQADKPALILTGGDHVMDAFDQEYARASTLWDLVRKTIKDENSLPMRYCLGNHDVWGWNRSKSKTKGDEAGWGKSMALDHVELAKPYYSFDQAGWHFVVLDSVRNDPDDPNGYVGGLDNEQFEWLKNDLAAANGANTLILTHIPMMTVTVLDAKVDKGGDLKISGGLLYTDWPRVKALLQANPHVKCVIGGHMHRLDRVEFLGVTHLCNGAVCGNWWKGKHYEAAEGYSLLDLFDDGTVERTYVEYGWKAHR